MTSLHDCSAMALAAMIAERKVGVVEVIEAHLQRIKSLDSPINSVVRLAEERALNEAAAADEALAKNHPIGPLHGLPFTIKDSLDTAGVISTAGTSGRINHIPDADATVVARLRNAGAILLGKTNTPELTMCGDTDNDIYGRTNNPYMLSRSSGGSSGGSAAALACGFSAFDIGSDTGGSVREPAHYCGVAGLKPSVGRVPRTGHIIPWGMGAVDSLTHLGPITRSVEDLWHILAVIDGPDWIDPSVVPVELRDFNDVKLPELRIATYADNGIVELHREMQSTMRKVTDALSNDDLRVIESRPPALAQAAQAVARLRSADGGAMTRRLLQKIGTDKPGAMVSACLQGSGRSLSGEAYSEVLESADEARSRMLEFMQDFDAIVCPVSFGAARQHGDSLDDHFDLWSYSSVYNLTGWPAAVVRAGVTGDGLPLGVQVVARPFRDDVAIALTRRIEQLLGGYQPPTLR